MQVIALVVATLTLTVIAAIHVAWGMDSTWPFATSAQLARSVVGDRGESPTADLLSVSRLSLERQPLESLIAAGMPMLPAL